MNLEKFNLEKVGKFLTVLQNNYYLSLKRILYKDLKSVIDSSKLELS